MNPLLNPFLVPHTILLPYMTVLIGIRFYNGTVNKVLLELDVSIPI